MRALLFALLIVCFPAKAQQDPYAPNCITSGSRTYCTLRYNFPVTPFTCTGGQANWTLPQSKFIPSAASGKTVYITQATANIWGVQRPYGGFFAPQIVSTGSAMASDIALAVDGFQPNTIQHPGVGLPFRPTDVLQFEYGCIYYAADYAAWWVGTLSGSRQYGLMLWFYYD